jgi:hypothetical protein
MVAGNVKRSFGAAVLACVAWSSAACEQQAPLAPIAQAKSPEQQPAPVPTENKTDVTNPEKPSDASAPAPSASPESETQDSAKEEKKSDASNWPPPANPPLPTMSVKLAGRTFQLEQAIDDETRFKGLSGRTTIAEDGGMIFIFPQGRCKRMEFVMRDCPIDIDIIYVNANARITAMHHMKTEAPRATHEQELKAPAGYPDAPKWTWSNDAYESRLRKWSSRYDCCVAIELRAGTLKLDGDGSGIELKVGDKLELDLKALQAKAK